MNETTNRPRQQLNGHDNPTTALATVPQSEQKRLVQAVQGNESLQQILATVSTPAGELLQTISKALGPAEAEIEFVERITIREG